MVALLLDERGKPDGGAVARTSVRRGAPMATLVTAAASPVRRVSPPRDPWVPALGLLDCGRLAQALTTVLGRAPPTWPRTTIEVLASHQPWWGAG